MPPGVHRTELVQECWTHVPGFVRSYDPDRCKGMPVEDYVYHRANLRMRDILKKWTAARHESIGFEPESRATETDGESTKRLVKLLRHLSAEGRRMVQELVSGSMDFLCDQDLKKLNAIRRELGRPEAESPREELARMVEAGLADRAIAERLGVDPGRVATVATSLRKSGRVRCKRTRLSTGSRS